MALKEVDKVVVDQIKKNDFLQNYQLKEQPLVIRKGCSDWPACNKWNLRFFESIGKDVKVKISQYKKLGHQDARSKSLRNLSELMAAYQNYDNKLSTSISDSYIAGWHYLTDFPSLDADLNVPDIFEDNVLPKINDTVFHYDWSSLFIGHKDNETPCHTDSFYVAVWIALIYGTKTLRYVSSEHHDFMFSGIDLFDKTVYEDLNSKGVDVYETTITTGDIVYHPPGWWHQVKNHSVNIAVSNNYVSPPNYLAFEQQLLSKTVLPMLMKLSGFKKDIGLINSLSDKTSNLNISRQALETSNYVSNQLKINQVFKNYHDYYTTILNLLN